MKNSQTWESWQDHETAFWISRKVLLSKLFPSQTVDACIIPNHDMQQHMTDLIVVRLPIETMTEAQQSLNSSHR